MYSLLRRVVTLTLVLTAATSVAVAAPRVVTSMPPVTAIVTAVAGDAFTPVELLPAGASPHTFALTPSRVTALTTADLVIWVGSSVETGLAKPISTLLGNSAVIELLELPGLALLPVREGGVWEAHDDDNTNESEDRRNDSRIDRAQEDGRASESTDPHVWLDPRNVTVIGRAIAKALASIDPINANQYRANAEVLANTMTRTEIELSSRLGALKDKRYLVFHDAYQYLERRFALRPVGAVTLSPERAPGAKRIHELRRRITDGGVACLFREPQLPPKLAETLIEGTSVQVGVLDPVGTGQPPEKLFNALAKELEACLG